LDVSGLKYIFVVSKHHKITYMRIMMSKSNITNFNNISNSEILKNIGNSLKQTRLKKNITQDELSKISGLDRTTISQLENGRAATLLTLVQILRALDELNLLDILSEEPEVSPLVVAKLKKQTRQRASGKKTTTEDKKESEW
jgi:transcriptional regulator with XRE-family HTH domain